LICKVLQIAPSGYWRHVSHQRNPQLRCARAQRDETLIADIERVWQANKQVYGADKVWKQMKREGFCIARCTVERLMKRLVLQGARRGKVVRTTISDRKAPCPQDWVKRQFKADRPKQLWVSDFTYVSTWQSWLYVAFVIDVYSRRIVDLPPAAVPIKSGSPVFKGNRFVIELNGAQLHRQRAGDAARRIEPAGCAPGCCGA
jgi:putative transposase